MIDECFLSHYDQKGAKKIDDKRDVLNTGFLDIRNHARER